MGEGILVERPMEFIIQMYHVSVIGLPHAGIILGVTLFTANWN